MKKTLLFLLFWTSLFAFDINDNISIRGFATLDAVVSPNKTAQTKLLNSDSYTLEDNKLSYDYSNFGLQLDARLNDSLRVMTQAVYSKENSNTNHELSLEWLMLIYDFGDDYQFRAGIMKIPFMQATQTSNINYSFLWSRPTLAAHGVNGFEYMEGVELRKKTYIDDVDIELQLTYGKTEHDLGIDKNDYTWNVASLFSYEDSWLRLSYGQLRFDSFNANGVQTVSNTMLTSMSAETQLSYEKFSFHAGISTNTNNQIPDLQYKYMSLSYDFDLVRPYLLYTQSKLTNIPFQVAPPGPPPPGAPPPGRPDGYEIEKNYSIGARYDIDENLAMKFAYSKQKVKTQSTAETSDDIYTLTLDLVF